MTEPRFYRASLGIVAFLVAGCLGEPEIPRTSQTVTRSQHPEETRVLSKSARPTETTKPSGEILGDRMAGQVGVNRVSERSQEPSPFRFAEVASESGIDFRHVSGMTEARHFPTANGSGVALIDYDGDGRLDLYFATTTFLPVGSVETGSNRLYRNRGDGTYEDATQAAGVGFRGFCHGVVVGDVDNDGDPDLFLCNYGKNVLYENQGDGTFRDISQAAGFDQEGWSTGGAFLDYDNDGDLDLYVTNYGDWNLPQDDLFCGDRARNIRFYCSPRSIRTTKHYLYRNNGDRTFTDVLDTAGIGRNDGHGFAAVAADVNDDGLIDLWVANDLNPKFLFLNKGDGTFADTTEFSGASVDANGNPQSGMGVDAEDVDGDGLPELFSTHFANEYNTLYQNLGRGAFLDQTSSYGIAAASIPYVGWGCLLGDFNNDGWPDCFVTNGHVDDNRHLLNPNYVEDYRQPAGLFLNYGAGPPPDQTRRFRLATKGVGPYFDGTHVGRGAAFGDLDNDGDLDIVVNHKDDSPALLRNETPIGPNHWIRIKLVGTRSNRDAIGARIRVEAGHRTITRQKKSGQSLMSSHDPRVLIGLGEVSQIDRLTVRWPSGAESLVERLPTDQEIVITEPALE